MRREARQIQSVGNSIASVGSGLTKGITVPIISAGAASFKLASDMNESLSKTEVAFKKNANQIKSWSKTTLEQYGISQGAALEYASKYGDMATGMGFSTKAAAKLSKSITGLVGDLASYKNITQEQADTALTAIYTGETESLKQLGIVMTQTNLTEFARSKGIKKNIKDMTQQEQVMLRYKYVMNATKNAQGDFARTNGQAANQMRIAKEGLKQLGASLGTVLLPPITKVISMANKLISRFNGMDESQKKMIVRIAGVAAAVGPALLVFGKMVAMVGTFRLKWVKLLGKVRDFGGISKMMMSPAGQVVLVLAAIAAAAIVVYKNWDKITAVAKKFKNTVVKTMNESGLDTKKYGKIVKQIGISVVNAFIKMGNYAKKLIKWLQPIANFIAGAFKIVIGAGIKLIIGYFSGWLKSTIDIVNGVRKTLSGITDFISGVFTGNWSKAWNGVKKIFSGVFQSLSGIAKRPLNAVIGMVNTVIGGLNRLNIKIPSWVPGKYGGKSFGINISKIPMLAKGTNNWPGGIAQVHEKGGEIIDLPHGTRVYPHDESIRKARKEGSKNIKIAKLADTIIVREEADIDEIVRKIAEELEKIA